MSEGRVVLIEKDMGDYLFLARPCVDMTDEAVDSLVHRAAQDALEFVGVVQRQSGETAAWGSEAVVNLSDRPQLSLLIRDVCAGLYKKQFLAEHGIEQRNTEHTIFPDLDILWQTFIFASRAGFVTSDVCESVRSDTIWIDEYALANDVRDKYEYIKTLLQKDSKMWNKWKSHLALQRFRCNYELLHWMDERPARGYADRVTRDMAFQLEKGQIDMKLFSGEEQEALRVLKAEPEFFKKFYLGVPVLNKRVFDRDNDIRGLKRELDKKRREIDNLKDDKKVLEAKLKEQNIYMEQAMNRLKEQYETELEGELGRQKDLYVSSSTFKVGKAVMSGPMAAKKAAKRIFNK